jgi:HJR/Mrr/RecB family endonuclease
MLAGSVHRDLREHLSVDEYALALRMLEDLKDYKENELTFPLFSARNIISDSISGEHLKRQLDSGSIVSGQQFEIWCKSALEHKGWKVEETTGSGDQGVDLIGWHSGVKVVFQCKHYSKTVGNSAVQEVIAGKVFYDAEVGVVITSGAGFSPSAVRLADAAGIILLSGKEIFSIGNRIDF